MMSISNGSRLEDKRITVEIMIAQKQLRMIVEHTPMFCRRREGDPLSFRALPLVRFTTDEQPLPFDIIQTTSELPCHNIH